MKILLVNAPPLKVMGVTSQLYPPLGLLYLASYARTRNPSLEFKILDGYQDKAAAIIQQALRFKPDVLGLSFTTQAATGAYAFVQAIRRELKDILIITGGPHPTIFPYESLQRAPADIAVVGEGEVTFSEILESLERGLELCSISGTVVRKNRSIKENPPRPFIEDLDSLPFPARDLVDLERYHGHPYKRRTRDTNIISSRGCPFACVFCSNPVWKFQKPWYRHRSPKNVVDEIEFIIKDYGITEFFDNADEVNIDINRTKSICDHIIARGLDINWKALMKIGDLRYLDNELADKLRRSGFWLAHFGIETLNDRTLKGIKKHQTMAQIERALDIMKNYQIKSFGYFIAFHIWEEDGQLVHETKEDSLRSLHYAQKLVKEGRLYSFGWGLLTPYPGSEVYNISVRHNLLPKDNLEQWGILDSTANFALSLPKITERDWIEVLNTGKVAQAKLMFTSGRWHWLDIPIYLKKAFYLLRMNVALRVQAGLKHVARLFEM